MTDMSPFMTGPVIFLHGTAGSPRQWHELIGHLPAGFETLTLDLPGYRAHEVPLAWRSLSDEADMIIQRLRAMGEPVHLVGHSYGGALALRVAMRYPGAIRSVVLFEPTMFHLLRDGHLVERQMFGDIDVLVQMLQFADAEGEAARGVARFIDFWSGAGSFAQYNDETRQRLAARMPLILANFAALDQENWPLSDLARLACPMLGIYGETSPLLAHHLTRLVAGAVADAKVLPVSGAGHLLPVTHARMAAKLLASHLRTIEARTPSQRPRVA